MNDSLKVENNILFYERDGKKYYPKASELYNYVFNESIVIDGLSLNRPIEIRFSKFGKNIEIIFEVINNKIHLNCYELLSKKESKIQIVNNRINDYIIINNNWYYLNDDVDILNNIVSEFDIKLVEGLTFEQYVKAIKKFQENDIKYFDNVVNELRIFQNDEYEKSLHGLQAKLFPYQDRGFNWLSYMIENNCGSILADEMGLGKTLQIIALFGSQKNIKKDCHFLVVAPISLLENWRREIEKFFPSLSTLVHHGSRRTGYYKELLNYDVVIMSYANVTTDLSMINMIEWDIVVLDEAQYIKNPYAQRTAAIKMINRKVGIAVTGTPFENHISDIWSIVDYVMPSYLGELSDFVIQFEDDVESGYKIDALIRPLMIRRIVKDVADDLPERIDIAQPILMNELEAMTYENERNQNADFSHFTLDKIQPLRKICTHLNVYDENSKGDLIQTSNKYSRLCEILDEIISKGEKAIIFTSYTKMIELLCEDLPKRFGIPTTYINGSVDADKRQPIIDEFSNVVGSAVLVINPKAGGAGLNITAANHVIHYNLEWNPAIEDQASARSYRRGQKNTVFVYRLFYANTIEEVMNERIQLKREISDAAIVGNDGTEQDKKDLLKALSLSPYWEGGKNES
ncbi:MAG: DEAD/DEAH box helicase [Clostridia bacterium]|nr:DEAD/DEAH box helicase [Clostridia bacterium]